MPAFQDWVPPLCSPPLPEPGKKVRHTFGTVTDGLVLAGGPEAEGLGGHHVEAGVFGGRVEEPTVTDVLLPLVHAVAAPDHVGVELEGIKRGHFQGGAGPHGGDEVVLPTGGPIAQEAGGNQALGPTTVIEVLAVPAALTIGDPRRGLEPVEGQGQGQQEGFFTGVEVTVIAIGNARDLAEGLVAGDGAHVAEHQTQGIRDQRRGDEDSGDILVEHDAAGEKRTLRHGGGLKTGRNLDVAAGPLELQVGLIHFNAAGGTNARAVTDTSRRVGGGEGAMAPGVLDHQAQTEFHGLVGDEIRAQAEAFPDLEVFPGAGTGALDVAGIVTPVGPVPAGKVPVGKAVSINKHITRHPHLGGCLGADRGRHHEGSRHHTQKKTFHESLLRKWSPKRNRHTLIYTYRQRRRPLQAA